MPPVATSSPILFFDGVCNLCTRSVQFIIRHDKRKQFLFASLQSEHGREAIKQLSGNNKNAPDSLVLFYKGKWHTRSSAALHICKILGGPWTLLFAGIIIPRFLRDATYDLLARNRYEWFGKREECMVPTPDLNERFLN